MLLTKRQNEILTMIKEKSPISGDEIARNLSVTKSALRTDFSILTGLKLITSKPNKGYIYNRCTSNVVKNHMSPQNSIDIKTSVYDAVIHLFNYDLGTLIVVENGKLVNYIKEGSAEISFTWEKYGENSCKHDYDKNAEHSILL